MRAYKWNVNQVKEDINQISKLLNSDDKNMRKLAIKDLHLIDSILPMNNAFDDETEQKQLLKKVRKLCSVNALIDRNINQLNKLTEMNKYSELIITNLHKYSLKKPKHYKIEKSNLLEGIMWVENLFKDIDANQHQKFQNYMNSGLVRISDNEQNTHHSYLLRLKTIDHNYSNIKFNNSLVNTDNILYGFFANELYRNNNKQRSIFDESLEVFYYLKLADMLKEHGYEVSYHLKYNIYRVLNNCLPVFQYITQFNKNIEFNPKDDKYIINKESSLYDGEMISQLKRGVTFDAMINYISVIYTRLLGIYLYQQYSQNQEKTMENISNLLSKLGTVNDNELLKVVGIDLDEFTSCHYYNDFIQKSNEDFISIKKIKRK